MTAVPATERRGQRAVPSWRTWTLLALLGLAGCESLGQASLTKCPRVSILPNADRVTHFRDNGGHDLTDVTYQAQISDIKGTCEYLYNKDTGKTRLNMEVRLVMGAKKGPANRDGKVAFKYFVSVLDPAGTILNKGIFRVGIKFPRNTSRVVLTDQPVRLKIPARNPQEAKKIEVIVGFQLSEEELNDNRTNRYRFLQ